MMGFNVKLRGRGTLAIYSSVRFLYYSQHHKGFTVTFKADRLRRCVRIYCFSYHTFSSLHHRDVDHRELGYLYHRNLFLLSSHRSYAHPDPSDEAEDCHQAGCY
jgi:hypothetical protein